MTPRPSSATERGALDSSASKLEQHYVYLQSQWDTVDATNEYSRLVVPTGNSQEPIHRWFHLKEAFSHSLLSRVIKDTRLDANKSLQILDCFAGGGTTIVSAIDSVEDFPGGVTAVGYERNPFLFRVAAAKSKAAAAAPHLTAVRLKNALQRVRKDYDSRRKRRPTSPSISTWTNDSYFPIKQRHKLLNIRESIRAATTSDMRDLLLVLAAATVEPCSMLRRDGRALRYEPDKKTCDPWDEFERRVFEASDDLRHRTLKSVEGRVVFGDGRFTHELEGNTVYDLILFSPPYPNNIDYTEIYKMEGWYLGDYRSAEDFRRQRFATVRSHPSINYGDQYNFGGDPHAPTIDKLIAPVIEAVPAGERYTAERIRTIKGYVDDMYSVLKSARQVVKPHGKLVYVVGNSAHGTKDSGFVIAADILMAGLAECAGWHVEEIKVARIPSRRRSESVFLRESVVVLKPGTTPIASG